MIHCRLAFATYGKCSVDQLKPDLQVIVRKNKEFFHGKEVPPLRSEALTFD